MKGIHIKASGENMITALFIALITADIAEILYSKLREIQFSLAGLAVYFIIINLAFICYMLFVRQEPFSFDIYYCGPKAVLRYISFALALCAAAPFAFSAPAGPGIILSRLRRSVWVPVSLTIILVLSAGSYITYKKTEAVSLTTGNPTYTEPVYSASP